jgi:hypothetical protein
LIGSSTANHFETGRIKTTIKTTNTMGRRSYVIADHQKAVTLAQSIRNAIHQGAPLFNDGKEHKCYELYLATAYAGLSQQTVHTHGHEDMANLKIVETMGHQHDNYTAAESQSIIDLLTSAVQEATAQASAKDFAKASWILRRAFDEILLLSTQQKKTTKESGEETVEASTSTFTGKQEDVSGDELGDGSTERAKADQLVDLCNTMSTILDIGDHHFRLKTYPNTFVGKEAVTKLLEKSVVVSRSDAVQKVNELMRYGLVYHTTKEHAFKDEGLFYKLTSSANLKLELSKFGDKIKSLQGDSLVQYATLLGRYKQFHKHPSLGVLRLDYSYPAAPGDIDHPDTYDYPVYYSVVPGLTFEMCQEGILTPAVGDAFDEAVLWLANHKAVTVITGDCGFMFWFVERVRKIASKTIISLSPLMQLPIMVAACAPRDKILVLTANGKSLDPMLDLIKRQCGIDGQNTQFVFVGCENVPNFGVEVAKGLKVDVAKAEAGIVALSLEMLQKYPDTRMILFECTELPPYSDAVREATRLPVMDAITNCDFFMAGFLDNKNFGLNGWYEEWDGVQEEFRLGQNLDSAQQLQCVWCKDHEHNYAK